MIILGIDPNTKYYAVVGLHLDHLLPDGKPDLAVSAIIGEDIKGRYAEERLTGLFSALWSYVQQDFRIGEIWCEEVAYTGGSRSLVQMGLAVHNVRLIANLETVPFRTMPNTTWKKEVIGRGNVSKEEITAFLQQTYGCEFAYQDLYDAYGVAVAGLRRHRLDLQNAPGAS